MPAAIRAVLFDVGGPLDMEVEHERLMDRDILEALATEGIAASPEALAETCRAAVERFAPNAYAAMIWELSGHDPGAARRAFGALSTRDGARRAARGGIELRPGMAALLERLDARGLLLGIVANQPAEAIAELERAGLGRYFAHHALAGSSGLRKPDVRLFLQACDALRVAPPECVMVGDRVDNDIVPARSLGMRTILFRAGRHAAQQPRSADEVPDREVTTLAGLERALAELVD